MSEINTIKVANRTLPLIEADLHAALKSETTNKIRIGGLLVEAKQTVKHGQWLAWLGINFGLSERSAQHYMKASMFATKYESGADLKLRLTAIYALDKYDEETVAAVMKVAETEWLNGESVDRVAEAFQLSKEQVGAISAERAEAKVEQEAKAQAEAEAMLDAAPPELPPSAAEATLPRDELLTAKFQQAVKMLKGIVTKPAARFVRADYSAADLELIANFLNQVAAEKQRVV
jgi:hypothetical protein